MFVLNFKYIPMLIELMDGFAITVENVVNPKKPKATGCQEYMTISKMSQVTTLLWKRVMDRMKGRKIELMFKVDLVKEMGQVTTLL